MNTLDRRQVSRVTVIICLSIASLFHVQSSIAKPMFSDTNAGGPIRVFETSAAGHALSHVPLTTSRSDAISIHVDPHARRQFILGFGGSFTESSAHVLNALSAKQRNNIINAYFSDEGARYSLTRTHINSCDFSLGHYAYAMVPGDTALEHPADSPYRESWRTRPPGAKDQRWPCDAPSPESSASSSRSLCSGGNQPQSGPPTRWASTRGEPCERDSTEVDE